MAFTIYVATCLANGKSYVGFDSRWPKRVGDHRRQAGYGCGYKFHRAIRKHGWESFEWEALYQSLDGDHCLRVMEPHFIAERDSFRSGYNSTFGGEGTLGHKRSPETRAKRANFKHSLETRLKMRASALGKKRTPETIEKIKACRFGTKASPEARARMSASQVGKSVGRVASAETRAKMSAASRGRVASAETRAKMSAALKGRKYAGRPMSLETKQKISVASKKPKTAEARANMALAQQKRFRL